MPEHWLTEVERLRLTSYPSEIPGEDVVTYFTLTESDCRLLATLRGDDNRLGFALQLCTLRYLGFVSTDLSQSPSPVVNFLARQLQVSSDIIHAYGERPQTRTDHLQEIERRLGFHKASATEKNDLDRWLRERALEHDRPLLLLQLLCERLQAQRIIRPGLTLLERSVITVRQQAQEATWELIAPLLSAEDRTRLDRLLAVDEEIGLTPLNKGEALHALRRYLFVANEAQIRKRHPEDQLNQAACLNLVMNHFSPNSRWTVRLSCNSVTARL